MNALLPASHDQALHGVAQTRAIERAELARSHAPPLMQRAGAAVARLALAVAPHARRVWVAAGPGNNGGDGIEAAIHLKRAGRDVEIGLLAAASAPADAQAALQRAQAAGLAIRIGAAAPAQPLGSDDLAIDALLGLGASRAPEGAIAEAIRALGSLPCAVLAVDQPSGLDADTGRPLGDACVVAQHTLTLLTAKPGLFTASGRDHAGRVWLDTLGVDLAAHAIAPTAWLRSLADRLPLDARRHAQHKGSFGDVAIVGGDDGMVGAALLAARAAHAAGAGRVFVELLGAAAQAGFSVDGVRPELMFRPGWSLQRDALKNATVVGGCGGGDAMRAVLARLLGSAARLVLDADALNAIAGDASLAALLRARPDASTVLTPHPLEAARLLGSRTADVQADRLRAADELAAKTGAVVVLKGSGSIVAAPGVIPGINASGNAALASPGTGDVLAGWIGGSWAESAALGWPLHEIVSRAVAEHGAAAEPAPARSLRANDLIEILLARAR